MEYSALFIFKGIFETMLYYTNTKYLLKNEKVMKMSSEEIKTFIGFQMFFYLNYFRMKTF